MKPPISKFKVYGNSMFPTLKEGQEVLTFNWGQVKAGDIVVIKDQKIKRVQKIMGNKIYLVGDNKAQSTDSRHFGPVNSSQVIGKVLYYFHDTEAGK